MKTKHLKHMFLLITLLILILTTTSVNAENTDNTTVHKILDKQDSNVKVSTAITENKDTVMDNGNLSKINFTKNTDNLKKDSSTIYVNSNGDNQSDGRTETNPTTLLNAFSNIMDCETIIFITDTDNDIYTFNNEIIIDKEEVKYGEETIPLSSELSEISLVGLEGKNITFTSNQNNRIFTIKSGITLTISNLNFDKCGNNVEDYNGGAIYTESNLKLTNCTFTNNIAGTYGGAILINNTQPTEIIINNVTFEENKAEHGSVIALLKQTTLNITKSHFNNNTATQNATIYNNNSKTNIKNTIFKSNKAENGAIIYATNNGQTTLEGNKFVNNTASNEASIIYNDKSTAIMTNNIIENNNGLSLLHNTQSTDDMISNMILYHNIINDNLAYSSMIISNGNMTINSNEFRNNIVTGSDYIINNHNSTLQITNNIFVNNTDDTRDMLIGGNTPTEISNNDYLDNYLNDTLEIEVNGTLVNISLNLNEIYNDTIKNGTLHVYIDNEEYKSWQIECNEYSFEIDPSTIDDSSIELKIEYITESKHYQNITLTQEITLPTKTTIETEIINTTWSNPQIQITVLNNEENPINEGYITIKDTQTQETILKTPITENTTNIILEPLNEIKEYDLTIEFSGSNSYLPSSTTITFNTTPQEITYQEFSFENQNPDNQRAYIDETYKYNDILDEDYSITDGKWIITIDDQIVLNTTNPDNHQITIPDNLSEGIHNITGNFTNKYYYANTNNTFTTLKQTPRIITNPTTITDTIQAENIEISIISDSNVNDNLITEDSNVTISIEEIDLSIRKVTTNGELTASIDIPELGVYSITVIFEENNKYAQVQTTIPVELDRTKTTIELNLTPATQLFENITATGQLTDNYNNPITNANITITVNNDQYQLTTDNQGIFKTELTIKSANNKITAQYNGNTIYQPSTYYTLVNLDKEKVEWAEFEMDDNILVEVGLSQKIFSGRLVLERNNTIGIPNATINYHIDTYDGKNNHNDTEYYTIVTDENGYFTANEYPSTKFSHENYHKNIYEDYYPNLVISFDGDDNYYPINETKESYITTFPRLRLALHFHSYDTIEYKGKLYEYDYIYGSEYYDYVIVSTNTLLPEEIPNCIVNITVYSPTGEQNMGVHVDNNGKANYHFKVTREGVYGISADAVFPSANLRISTGHNLLLIRSNGTIQLDSIKGKYIVNDTVKLSGKLLDSKGKLFEGNVNITMKVNNKTETTIPVHDGLFEYRYTPLNEGRYNITLEYEGDTIHKKIKTSKAFNVTKLNTTINISEPSNNKKVTVGNDVTFSGQLKDSRNIYLASKDITITINNKTYTTTTNQQGKFTIPITILETGILNVTISYDGDIVYNPSNTTLKLNSNSKMKIVFDGYNEHNLTETVIVDDKLVIKGRVYDNYTQNTLQDVQVSLSMINYTCKTKTNQDGEFTLEIPTKAGNYNLNILFNKEYYNTPKEVFKVIVNKKNLTLDIQANPQDLKLADNITIIIKATENETPINNQTVYIRINDDVYNYTTDEDGIINFTTTTKQVGQNNIIATSQETSHYYTNKQTATFNVDYNTVKLEATTDSNNTRYDDNVTIYVTVSDAYDNPITNHPITIKINENTTYNLTTDTTGKTNITVTANTIGENNITIIMEETENYLEHTANITYNVRKLNTTLSINNTPITIEANENEEITITVTLTDEDGTPIENQKINIQYDEYTINEYYTSEEGSYLDKLPKQYETTTIHINAYYEETNKYLSSTNNLTITIEVPPQEDDNTTTNTTDTNNTNEQDNTTNNTTQESDDMGYGTGNQTKPHSTPTPENNTNINNNTPNPPNPNPTQPSNNPPYIPPKPVNPINPINPINPNTPQQPVTPANPTNNNKPSNTNTNTNPTKPTNNPTNTTPQQPITPTKPNTNNTIPNTPHNKPEITDTNTSIPENPQNTNKNDKSGDNEIPNNPKPNNKEENENKETNDKSSNDKDIQPETETPTEQTPENPQEEPTKDTPQEETPDNTNENPTEPENTEDNKQQTEEQTPEIPQETPEINPTETQEETPENNDQTPTQDESPVIDSTDSINVEDNTIAAVATTNKAYEIIQDPLNEDMPWTWIILLIIVCGSVAYGYLRFKEP